MQVSTRLKCDHSLIHILLTIVFSAYILMAEELEFSKVIGKEAAAVVYSGKWRGRTVALKRMRIPTGCDAGNYDNHK